MAERSGYFTGRLGGARITLLKSRETADDGGEIWQLMIAEAPQRQEQRRQRDDAKPEPASPAGRHADRFPASDPSHRASGPDSEIPF